MTLISIPANPVPEDVVTGNPQDARRRHAALCALGAASRDARARSACSRAAPNSSRSISRPCAICAPAVSRSRRSIGAARACRIARCAIRARAMCAASTTTTSTSTTFIHEVVLPDCPPPYFALAHSMGATVLLRAAYQGHRWFDRMVLLAPMIALPGMRRSSATRVGVKALRLVGLRRRLRAGRRRVGDDAAAVHRQSAHLRSGALCPQHRGAGGGAELAIGWPTVGWADSAFKRDGRIRRAGLSGARSASRC